jgi:AcrR family transcriptional regulator
MSQTSRTGFSSPLRLAGADARRRQPRGRHRRQQILDAAIELFATKGYRGTGVAELAERVGMTPTGLLYYFGTKERLLHEVVAERDRADGLDAASFMTLEGLRDLGQHNVETAVLTRLYIVLGAESLEPDDPLHDFFVERYDTARRVARSILAAEQERGAVRADVDLDQIALEIVSVLMGLEVQWLADPDRIDLVAAVRAYIDRLIAELSPKPAASPRRPRARRS